MSAASGLQYSNNSPLPFTSMVPPLSPEVISLQASVNDKDIDLIDLRRRLEASLREATTLKEELKVKDRERNAEARKHEQAVSSLEKELLARNDQIRKLTRESRQLSEDVASQQKKCKELAKDKNQRIEVLKDEFKTQLEAAKRHFQSKEDAEEKTSRLRRDLAVVKHEKKLGEDLAANEVGRLKGRISELVDKVDQATKDANRLKRESEKKSDEIRRLKQECEDKQQQLAVAASQLQMLPLHFGGSGLQERKENVPAASAQAGGIGLGGTGMGLGMGIGIGMQQANRRRLEFELYEKEHRKKFEAMQQSMYRLQEKLDARVATSRKYKEAGRMLQRKVAELEAERYSKQQVVDALSSRIDKLDKELESTCEQLSDAKKSGDQMALDFERELKKRESVLKEALSQKESAESLVAHERQNLEAARIEADKLLDENRKMETELSETARAYRSQKDELESLQSQVSNLKRRLSSADGHIEKVNSLLKEKDLDAERSRTRYQDQQSMIERQEHELSGMRIQYENHLKKVSQVQSQMQAQRQELERFKSMHFEFDPSNASAGRPRTTHHYNPLNDTGGAFQSDTYDEQIAYLRSELDRSMQREKSLILNIQDREKKLENAEKYLGNMDKVVQRLSKYS